ncbi:MAG: hypothetical protein C0599_11850 [Salinivirgaceae bacterium]|nr:MAG: hypothetical protein C0599_11850 [Salinivirgaceae bacterium]
MKKLMNALVLVFVMSTISVTTLSAKEPVKVNSETELENAIKNVVEFPRIEDGDAKTTTIDMLFKVNSEGKIQVVSIEGTKKHCRKLRRSLKKLYITEESMYGKYFNKKITFELIK